MQSLRGTASFFIGNDAVPTRNRVVLHRERCHPYEGTASFLIGNRAIPMRNGIVLHREPCNPYEGNVVSFIGKQPDPHRRGEHTAGHAGLFRGALCGISDAKRFSARAIWPARRRTCGGGPWGGRVLPPGFCAGPGASDDRGFTFSESSCIITIESWSESLTVSFRDVVVLDIP